MAALPPPALPNTIERALITCGVNIDNALVWNGYTTAQRIAEEVFSDSFNSFMDISFSELDDYWRTYSHSQLTIANSQIILRPITKSNIKALIQWGRDCMRLNIDTSTNLFPIGDKVNLLQ